MTSVCIGTTYLLLTVSVLNVIILNTVLSIENSSKSKNFRVYWNVPTFICNRYGIYFSNITEDYGIIQNPNDDFRGSEIAIFYNLGLLPSLEFLDNGSLYSINGGVPEKFDKQKHVENFSLSLDDYIGKQFFGIGIFDYKLWRPIFRQNIKSLLKYKRYSVDITKNLYPGLNYDQTVDVASMRFEFATRNIIKGSILMYIYKFYANATWGFHDYPSCFSIGTVEYDSECHEKIKEDNDKLSWLWNEGIALFPALYIKTESDMKNVGNYINARLSEAYRVSREPANKILKIYPYFRYTYKDINDQYLTFADVYYIFSEAMKYDIDGIIIWGSSNDFMIPEQCQIFQLYVQSVLGPIIKFFTKT